MDAARRNKAPTGQSYGTKCEKCGNDSWIVYFTDHPRKGDREEECYGCGAIRFSYRNEQSVDEYHESEEETVLEYCHDCESTQPVYLHSNEEEDICECTVCGTQFVVQV